MYTSLRRVSLLALAISLCFSTNIVSAATDDDEVIEEVIVTGSYIRRDNFDIPSPIDVVTELDLELAGTADLGDIIFDQTFQFGVNANATPFEYMNTDDQQWNQGQEVWANLRGLGTRATMTMMDGHRLPADTNTWGRRAGVDINGTYPQIAIGRIETILDGASALYGAEAVGGVINLIPKKDFEGLEISYDTSQAFDGGSPVTNLSLLAGVQGERGGAIFAVELRDQERMRYTERPDFILSASDPWLGVSNTADWHDAGTRSLPGDFIVPVRTATGELRAFSECVSPTFINCSGAPNHDWDSDFLGTAALGPIQGVARPDPGCGYGFGAGNDDMGVVSDEWGDLTTAQRQADGRKDRYVINDLSKPGNFLNGFQHHHANTWGYSRCIMSVTDYQDMQAESDNNKAMAYFEYEFNEYIKLRGEIVLSQNDYNTRDVTGGVDEIDTNEVLGPMSMIVIGHNPGNPFRAYADGSTYDPTGSSAFVGTNNGYLDWDDLDGNGLYDYGVEPGEYYLFSPDSDGDGRPDRSYRNDGIADGNNAQGDIAATVILFGLGDTDGNGVPDRFDQDWALSNGGIRLFEDVRGWQSNFLNVHPKNARNNTLDWAKEENGALHYERRFIRDNTRIRLGAEISIPNTDWIVDFDYIWTKGMRENNYPEPDLQSLVKSLRCEGGSDTSGQGGGTFNIAGNGSCWNPFSTSYLNTTLDGQLIGDESIKWPDADDPGWRPFEIDDSQTIGFGGASTTPGISPEVNTDLENRNAGIIMEYNLQELGMSLIDVVASTGSLFDLPWNDQPVGFAIGYHHREESEEFRSSVINQTAIGGGKRGLRESIQTTDAIFMELNLPLLEHEFWGSAELQIAARYAEIETKGVIGQIGKVTFDTVIPKIAFRYSPVSWMSVRASATEGFVTPGLYAMFGTPGQYSGPGTSGGGRQTVGDYVCDWLPEMADCDGVSLGGGTSGVWSGSTPNQDLGAEESDLFNVGLSLRLLDGDLTFDADFTSVDFEGRVEQLSGATNVGNNQVGFEDYLLDRCPGTLVDWDNPIKHPDVTFMSNEEYIAATPAAELQCRVDSAVMWVTEDAAGGNGEQSIGTSIIARGLGPNGLRLTVAETPWVQQGEQKTETMIYAMRFNFEGEDLPLIGGDYGSFTWSVSATQMLESSIIRFTSQGCHPELLQSNGLCLGDSPATGVKVDGVGNRNYIAGSNQSWDNLMQPLPPSPEWRVNTSLTWFYGNHMARLTGRWHDSITNLNSGWDQIVAAGLVGDPATVTRPKSDTCGVQPVQVCGMKHGMYWDLSYSWNKPDFMGMDLNVNVAVRNIFDHYPEAFGSAVGHEGYIDNIMGRVGYLRVGVSL